MFVPESNKMSITLFLRHHHRIFIPVRVIERKNCLRLIEPFIGISSKVGAVTILFSCPIKVKEKEEIEYTPFLRHYNFTCLVFDLDRVCLSVALLHGCFNVIMLLWALKSQVHRGNGFVWVLLMNCFRSLRIQSVEEEFNSFPNDLLDSPE